jgi:hypothetical protein
MKKAGAGWYIAAVSVLCLAWVGSVSARTYRESSASEDLCEQLRVRNAVGVNKALARGADANVIYRSKPRSRGIVDFFRSILTPDRDRAYLTALMVAAISPDPREVKSLLRHGADPNRANGYGQTALMIAVSDGNVEAARALIDGGANVNLPDTNGSTALHDAVMGLHSSPAAPKMVRLLVEAGADRTKRTREGRTPLDEAGRLGFADAAKPLLGHKDNVE